MCENDAAIDAYINTIDDVARDKYSEYEIEDRVRQMVGWKLGHYRGVIRELAATVPGVREWLIEHMPEEG